MIMMVIPPVRPDVGIVRIDTARHVERRISTRKFVSLHDTTTSIRRIDRKDLSAGRQ